MSFIDDTDLITNEICTECNIQEMLNICNNCYSATGRRIECEKLCIKIEVEVTSNQQTFIWIMEVIKSTKVEEDMQSLGVYIWSLLK